MAKILVAEDDPDSLQVVEMALTKWGHTVIACTNGTDAWAHLTADDSPSLAILDIKMPGYSGIELLQMLEERASDDFIYTIILTACDSYDDVLAAFRAGAQAFLQKPCDLRLLKSRIKAGLRLAGEKRALENINAVLTRYVTRMEALAEERARQLVHADRMSTLGTLIAGVAHEINNPMAFVSGNIQILGRYFADVLPLLAGAAADPVTPPEQARKYAHIIEELPKSLKSISNGASRVGSIVERLRSYSHRSETRTLCDVNECLQNALQLASPAFKRTVAALEVDCTLDPRLAPVLGNAQQLEQVFLNLVINAADALEPICEPRLSIVSEMLPGAVRVTVTDNGPGIADVNISAIWNPFFTTKAAGRGTGLGLTIARDITAEHRGQLTVTNVPEGGAQFSIVLPLESLTNSDRRVGN